MDDSNKPSEEWSHKDHKVLRIIRASIPIIFIITLFLSYFCWSHREMFILAFDFVVGLPTSITIIGLLSIAINKKQNSKNHHIKGLRIIRALMPLIILISHFLFAELADKWWCPHPCSTLCLCGLGQWMFSLPVFVGILVATMIILSMKISKVEDGHESEDEQNKTNNQKEDKGGK